MAIQILAFNQIKDSSKLCINDGKSPYSFYSEAVKKAVKNNEKQLDVCLDTSNGKSSLVEASDALFKLTMFSEIDVNLYVPGAYSYYDTLIDLDLDCKESKKPASTTGFTTAKKYDAPPMYSTAFLSVAREPVELEEQQDSIYDIFDELPAGLERQLKQKDTSFSKAVQNIIDEKGWKDPVVYHNANVSKSVFSTLRSNDDYLPNKNTALALVVGLQLNVDEANDLLKKAGYTLSDSNATDIIVSYFLRKKQYNIGIINAALYSKGEKTLGQK